MRHILLSNDDGLASAGLAALEEVLRDVATVWIVAPNREMSATSHSISLHRPIRVDSVGERRFAVDGTPADSVILALSKLLPAKPDLCIAGINKGGNMGENIFYSGTVAAAIEATLNHVPAFAISVVGRDRHDFGPAADFARTLALRILEEGLPEGVTLNVNVPQPWTNGVRLTRQSHKITSNLLVENMDPRGRKYYWLHEKVDGSKIAPETDYAAIAAGSISLTPLDLDRTDQRAMNHLSRWAKEFSGLDTALRSGSRPASLSAPEKP